MLCSSDAIISGSGAPSVGGGEEGGIKLRLYTRARILLDGSGAPSVRGGD